jgi:hypothetical protein
MGQLSARRIYDALASLFSSLDATDRVLLERTLNGRKIERVRLFDAATAGTAMTTTGFYTNNTGGNLRVTRAWVVTPVAVTTGETDFVTFTLAKVDSAGANAATVASGATNAASLGALVANTPEALALTVANVVIADGWTLTAAVAKAASGKAITAATSDAYLYVELQPE